MKNHLRGNLLLLGLTVLICCVLYPLVLYGIGQTVFCDQAQGSLVSKKGPDRKDVLVGSSLIASPFGVDADKGKPYFHPRPSAASYNATASGGSNLGASSPKLRDRVARQLGPIIKYNQNGPKKNDSVQDDIETWFKSPLPADEKRPRVVAWAEDNPTLAGLWVVMDANKPAVIGWLKTHPAILADWQKKNPDAPKPIIDDKSPTVPFDDIAVDFFKCWAAEHSGQWPEPDEKKQFKPVQGGSDLQATFFDSWLRAHPDVDLEKVPADMVTASGSGLDPHITLDNALSVYQLDRVARGRVVNPKDEASVKKMREDIAHLLKRRAFTPLSGLAGKPLINVLEINLELDAQYPVPAR
jgi:K+-transporting ATPase ATPase C chain